MSTNTHELSDEEKIDLIIQLIKTKMLGLRVNCLHEVEIIPTGLTWGLWSMLIQNWRIKMIDNKLMPKILKNLHKNGIVLAKHIESQ